MKRHSFPTFEYTDDGDTHVFIPSDVDLHRSTDNTPHEKLGLLLEEVSEPDDVFRLQHALATHIADPRDRRVIQYMFDASDLEEYVSALLTRDPLAYTRIREEARHALYTRIAPDDTHFNDSSITWPSAVLRSPRIRVPEIVARNTMAIIGDGPAAILMARMCYELGYIPGTTRIFSKSGSLNGIWAHDRVTSEGHNTFAPTTAFGAKLSIDNGRPGADLVQFLDELSSPIKDDVRKATVEDVTYDHNLKKYVVTMKNGGILTVETFDSVCVCSGNSVSAPLSSDIMQTNALELPGAKNFMKRWQEQIRDPSEFEGKSPMLVGLGNSSIAMIKQFARMHENGVDVHPSILTHHSALSLRNPTELTALADGTLEEPIERTRSNLSRLALDIPEVQEAFDYAMEQGWILDSVTRWDIDPDVLEKKKSLRVTVSTRKKVAYLLEPERIYALIGYRNDPAFMRKLGAAGVEDDGYLHYERGTNRIKTNFQDDPGRMYALGAVASIPEDRNQEVIPGMLSIVGRIAFADIVASSRELVKQSVEFEALIDSVRERLRRVVKIHAEQVSVADQIKQLLD